MGAIGLVGGNLVYRTAPLATDAGIFALSWTLFALIGLMVIDRLVGKLIATVPTPTGQLGYRLLYGQVTRRWVLADISTTIRAGRILIAESTIRQQMSQTAGAHQVTHGTLVHCGPWQIQTDGTAQDAAEASFQLFDHFGLGFIDFLSLGLGLVLIRVLGWACGLRRSPHWLLLLAIGTAVAIVVAQAKVQLLVAGHDLLGQIQPTAVRWLRGHGNQ